MAESISYRLENEDGLFGDFGPVPSSGRTVIFKSILNWVICDFVIG